MGYIIWILFLIIINIGVAVYYWRNRWKEYDPEWLVRLAKEQRPDEDWLHLALSKCTKSFGEKPYIHFVSAKRANKPGSQWQFRENISLESKEYGDVVLDVLKDGRIGGVEFLGLLS